jgi:hypothetical protein
MSNECDISFISCTGKVLSITVSIKLNILLVQKFAAQVYMRMFGCSHIKSEIKIKKKQEKLDAY